ncbi:MAG: hypothetical protein IKJ84_05025 [Oscillospiraceae bacterium]|nr:hypothetical protein [Oscillospiraceae bacterium]
MAIVQVLAQLAAVVCGDAELFVDYDAGDGLLMAGARGLAKAIVPDGIIARDGTERKM